MDIAVDRRRFLIAGSAVVATVAAGVARLWWQSADVTRQPADDAVRVVPGTDRQAIVPPAPAAPPPTLPEPVAAPDRDTEARLNRLIEDDAGQSQQRMRERRQRRSDAPPAIPAPPTDAASTTWAP